MEAGGFVHAGVRIRSRSSCYWLVVIERSPQRELPHTDRGHPLTILAGMGGRLSNRMRPQLAKDEHHVFMLCQDPGRAHCTTKLRS